MAMQALCLLDVQGDGGIREMNGFLEDQEAPNDAKSYARLLASEVWNKRAELDGVIAPLAEHWGMERMSPVDRNVTRIGVCELVGHADVPAAVAIDEAIEIAKEYGGADSAAFVNGILDAVLKHRLEGAGQHGTV